MFAQNHSQRARYGLLFMSVTVLGLFFPALTRAEDKPWCTCPGGGTVEPGAVRYDGNSDRETITKIKIEDSDSGQHCAAIWIGRTEIYPTGTPYSFHLKRRQWREQRADGCGDSSKPFLKRTKNYQFVFDADSQSIREMQLLAPKAATPSAEGKASSQSNSNLWDSISPEDSGEPLKNVKHAARNPSAPEFSRSAWVFARKEMIGYYVGLLHGLDKEEITTLRKTHKIKAGQLGQIEASNGRTALVRFYDGSRIEKFAKGKNALRRWYDNTGGPYAETKDDLYTPIRSCILEVPLDDLIEINDYLDEQKTDRT